MASGWRSEQIRPSDCNKMNSMDDSSESETEPEPAPSYHRRLSTNKDIKVARCLKEGYLMKQTSSFQRWRRRYFKLKGRKLYYAKDTHSVIFDEICLADLSLAECSTKNANHSFQVITPFRNVVLAAESRREMEEWINALRSAANNEFYDPKADHRDTLSGQHHWYACSHARPTYCNVCREALSGVTSHGLSCEVCKFKAHKKCAAKALNNCKWTTLSAVGGKDIIEENDGALAMPHQWLEGNLPVSAKCSLCDRTCGSVLRLQDYKCLWCKAVVHISCRDTFHRVCPLKPCHLSILPPIAINNIDHDGYWEAARPPNTCPLLVFVNSKSGDNQGVKFYRRFKQILNPAQVFDLMNGGPYTGLRLFQRFDRFRILVCGGDGSVGWVLTEMDKMDEKRQRSLLLQCQVAVLPLGTGNDLARVLGWGSAFDDDTQLQTLTEKLERAQIKMLDRWSIMTYEGSMPPPRKISSQFDPISVYEDSVAAHLSKILQSDDHTVVISSAKVLCETVKDFVAKVAKPVDGEPPEDDESIEGKCGVLNEKLDALLKTLNEEKRTCERHQEQEQQQRQQEKLEHNIRLVAEQNDTSRRPSCHSNSGRSMPNLTSPAEDENDDETPNNDNNTAKRTADALEAEVQSSPKPKRKTSSATFRQREALMLRANSLKRAVRQIIEHTEKAVDEQRALPTIVSQSPLPGSSPVPGSPVPGSPVPGSPVPGSPVPGMGSVTVHKDTLGTGGNFLEVPSFHVRPGSPGLTRHSKIPSPRLSPRLKRLEAAFMGPKGPSRRISNLSTCHRSKSYQSGLANSVERASPDSVPGLAMPLPHLMPSISSNIVHSIAGGSFISKVLLANADALCAAASPLIEEDIPIGDFSEKCVMNNYFGIGLDAKISLDFHTRREEHPEKCRSRTKNRMWYGMLGTKEILQKTFRNLDERVQLECDGQRIPLPSLQGLVVLNIGSYMGGTNFWGGKKEDDSFTAPSFDDKILEVVAVFGSIQMAMSRVISLQHHRIAQCRSIKITIMGDEGVPVQVDGEAWIQPPGYMRIVHKNRAQVLIRDREFESTLKSWSGKQSKLERSTSPTPPAIVSEEDTDIIQSLVEASSTLVRTVKVASITHSSVEQELFHMATAASTSLDRLYPSGKLADTILKAHVADLVSCMKILHHETSVFLSEKAGEVHLRQDIETQLSSALATVEVELRKIAQHPSFITIEEYAEESDVKRVKHGKFKIMSKLKLGHIVHHHRKDKDRSASPRSPGIPTLEWDVQDVALWLETVGLSEYKEAFMNHDVRGPELVHLERSDLKDLGICKIGHLKRLEHAIKDLAKHTNISFEKP